MTASALGRPRRSRAWAGHHQLERNKAVNMYKQIVNFRDCYSCIMKLEGFRVVTMQLSDSHSLPMPHANLPGRKTAFWIHRCAPSILLDLALDRNRLLTGLVVGTGVLFPLGRMANQMQAANTDWDTSHFFLYPLTLRKRQQPNTLYGEPLCLRMSPH